MKNVYTLSCISKNSSKRILFIMIIVVLLLLVFLLSYRLEKNKAQVDLRPVMTRRRSEDEWRKMKSFDNKVKSPKSKAGLVHLACLLSFWIHMSNISRVPGQNGVSLLYIMLEIRHSGREPSIWLCVTSHVLPVCWLAVLRGKNFNVGHYKQTFQQMYFITDMCIGTIDFYYFIPLSLTLILDRGHKVSAKQNLGFFFSRTLKDPDTILYEI